MENLTNEQIVDIINFYKMCGISEDMYLSRNGVLDLFSLIGIAPEFDEQGNRVPTVYEQLSIAPVFRDKKEVPIVFAIKHRVSKIHKAKPEDKISTEIYKYAGEKEQVSDKIILIKLRQDYFSAVVNGNMSEATRIYDLIDKITGGKADYFIGVQYNCVKFYKKMQKQLLIDMFANFVILMILSKKHTVKDGLIKFDKLYKAFIQKELSNGNFGLIKNNSISAPEISKISVTIAEDDNVKVSAIKSSKTKDEKISSVQKPAEAQTTQTFVSFVKEKIQHKLSKLKKSFEERIFASSEEKIADLTDEKQIKRKLKKGEQAVNILESD